MLGHPRRGHGIKLDGGLLLRRGVLGSAARRSCTSAAVPRTLANSLAIPRRSARPTGEPRRSQRCAPLPALIDIGVLSDTRVRTHRALSLERRGQFHRCPQLASGDSSLEGTDGFSSPVTGCDARRAFEADAAGGAGGAGGASVR